jgi:protein-tyrosine kinase
MSRVFEALTKAGHEKERQAEQEARGGGQNAVHESVPLASEVVEVHWPSEHNGYHHEVSVSLPESVIAPRSWREKVEELFFGWDLRRYATHPIVALEEESPASEQYKILREQLKRLRTEAGIRDIAITSPVKRDGKTTVAVNLAASVALEYEQKVLLIDADLRAPGIHRYFNADPSPGLTDYLGSNSNAGLKGLIRETHLSGLKIIPAGKPSRFASELLGKDKLRRMLDEIHTTLPGYVVVIDSPPVLATPDPLVLSRQVDGVIIVMRAGKTPKDYLVKTLALLNSDKVLGVVLNGADLGLGSKYYYYYSSNGHG